MRGEGIDAPICQDGRSGRQVCGLARSVVCHHALKDHAGEKACETADDLPFGPPFSGASFDVVEGWCVELHPHDDGPVERGVGRRSGQLQYSDLAIETALTLSLIFHLPLRQTEGFLTSIFGMLGVDLTAPSHHALATRSASRPRASARPPGHQPAPHR